MPESWLRTPDKPCNLMSLLSTIDGIFISLLPSLGRQEGGNSTELTTS